MNTPFPSDAPERSSAGPAEACTATPDGGFEDPDAFAQLALADVADADLLCLVLCATGAAMLLALAISLA